jgi:2-polyprenyl-3-methyl-5-hydroxy-6-metoxy-1,4-benzoquinol methylase
MLAERALQEELMDAPDLDPASYAALLADLAKVTTITMGRRPTLGFLDRVLGDRVIGNAQSIRVLDVGYGHGDMLRRIDRWAGSRGIQAELTGIDLNPKSAAVASAASSGRNINFLTGDYASLAGQGFDVILSSLVAHHMTHAQLIAFLRFMDREAKRGWLVNDLHRHGFAYAGYPLLGAIMGWHPIVKHDGRLSIARSYRPGEWPALLGEAGVEGARVFRAFPFRLCVEKIL